MKTIGKRLPGIDLRLLRKHIRQHEDCLNAHIQCQSNDYDHEDDYHWDCRSNCTDEFKSDIRDIPEPMKGRNSRKLTIMNTNRLSHFFPSFFMGGGLARPRQPFEYDDEGYVYG
jgi:hypothetical protein